MPSIHPADESMCAALTELATRSKAHWGYSETFMRACRRELEVTPTRINDACMSYRVAKVGDAIAGFYVAMGAVEVGSRPSASIAERSLPVLEIRIGG